MGRPVWFIDREVSVFGYLTPPFVPLVKCSALWQEVTYCSEARKQRELRKFPVPIIPLRHTPVPASPLKVPINFQQLQVKLQTLTEVPLENILDQNCSGGKCGV